MKQVSPKYDKIGSDYDATRKADPIIVNTIREFLHPLNGNSYLDIGCGSGNYTNALSKSGGHWIGMDPSSLMLELAKERSSNIEWNLGTAEETNFQEQTFNGVIATLTIHHWEDLSKAFNEIHRILKQGGKFIIFTSTPKQMRGYWLNHFFPIMLKDSIAQMPQLNEVIYTLKTTGFKVNETKLYNIRPDLEDKFLYCGKHDPAMYLDHKIRKGISSFSSLANQEEVLSGLTMLQNKINDNSIGSIMKEYENDFGDYLYLVATT